MRPLVHDLMNTLLIFTCTGVIHESVGLKYEQLKAQGPSRTPTESKEEEEGEQGLLASEDTPLGWSYAPRHGTTVGPYGGCVTLISSSCARVRIRTCVATVTVPKRALFDGAETFGKLVSKLKVIKRKTSSVAERRGGKSDLVHDPMNTLWIFTCNFMRKLVQFKATKQ